MHKIINLVCGAPNTPNISRQGEKPSRDMHACKCYILNLILSVVIHFFFYKIVPNKATTELLRATVFRY